MTDKSVRENHKIDPEVVMSYERILRAAYEMADLKLECKQSGKISDEYRLSKSALAHKVEDEVVKWKHQAYAEFRDRVKERIEQLESGEIGWGEGDHFEEVDIDAIYQELTKGKEI
jgi:hypothetical protein